ncbi:alkylhydroperoxidase domain protein [Georgenia sp. M64]|uniref:alkylhydroperoxidase domain protein n=1 Tax=Georgenia sp. M64 TaxID=3120520 RepID=UPI0030DFE7FB
MSTAPTTASAPTTVPTDPDVPPAVPDVVDHLLGTRPGSRLDEIRGARPAARANAQRSHEALLEPVDPTHVSLLERSVVAAFVSALHGSGPVAARYAAHLGAADPHLARVVAREVASGATTGPYGAYREPALAGESRPGPVYRVQDGEALGARLTAALEHAHLLVLRPREASPAALERLAAAGWSTDGIVTLAQLVSFLAFQVRVVHGLGALAAEVPDGGTAEAPDGVAGEAPDGLAGDRPEPGPAERAPAQVLTYPDLRRPEAFTRDQLGWVPWLEPLPREELTERHLDGLVDRRRADNDYFRLLVRDPEVLAARTRTDNDIFYNTRGGLPRAERELAATAASRLNGCVFCASVHARFAAHHSRRPEDVQRLLDEGVFADLGPRWDAVVAAAVALSSTPPTFGAQEVGALRAAGLDDLEIADLVHGAAFFGWANRLMLSLGEPAEPGV